MNNTISRVSTVNEWEYCSCHENIKFISSSYRVMIFLLYKHSDDGAFDDFRKISDHFPKISDDFLKLFWRPDENSRTFSENFRKFPKMSKDFRRLPKTFEEDLKMFRWYTNYFKYNLRGKLDNSEIIDIFTCEDIISSHHIFTCEDKVSFLSVCYHSVYHWLLCYKSSYTPTKPSAHPPPLPSLPIQLTLLICHVS